VARYSCAACLVLSSLMGPSPDELFYTNSNNKPLRI
jgi:hypothetical protein